MYCPNCGREISDQAAFCGYCGATLPGLKEEKPAPQQAEPQEAAASEAPPVPPPQAVEEPPQQTEPQEAAAAEESPTPPPPRHPNVKAPSKGKKKKKKRTGLKLFLVCCLLAIAAGGAMGFLTARGTIDWRSYLPLEKFVWTSPSEGETQSDPAPQTGEEEDEKGTADSSTGAASEADPSQGENPEAGEADAGEDSQGTPEPQGEESHYAMYRSSVLLVVDDQAQVMSQTAIETVLDRAKEAAASSGYSILLVLTDDLQGESMEAFASGYYARALEGSQGGAELKEDGFLFLVDVAGGESFLWTAGEAQMPEDITGAVQANLTAGEYETALLNVLERVDG